MSPPKNFFRGDILPKHIASDTIYKILKNMETETIGLEPIRKILGWAIASAYCKNEKTVSCLLIATPEAGKTTQLSRFAAAECVLWQTDVNMPCLLEALEKQIGSQKKRVLIIPDFLKLIMKKQSTSQNMISLLNALTEEGLTKIPMGQRLYDFEGLQMGFISAIPIESIRNRRRNWQRIGFLSRCLPVSFSYSPETIEKIWEFTTEERYNDIKPLHEVIDNLHETEVKTEQYLNKQLIPLSRQFAEAQGCYGFRLQKQLQILAKGRALLCGRSYVIQEDIDEIFKVSRFMNLDCNQV